ncbi:MAG TPA: tetratricopeptide repeat protein [Candidatus Rifleibacterium sp.]|nr:tetratricopeptide repeat protein [Candidatus Rifleibacterium sp.]
MRYFRSVAILLVLLVFCPLLVQSAEDEAILLKKSQLLVQRGSKAEETGDFEDAALLYEEALEVYPKNVMPLLRLGSLLTRVGMYDKARERLRAIPLERLSKVGQAEIHLLFGQISVARGGIEEAGSSFKKALEANPDNVVALIRKVVVEQLLGFSTSLELFDKYDSFQGVPVRELHLAYYLDLYLGNFARAYNTWDLIDNHEMSETLTSGFPPLGFLLTMPLGLGGIASVIYYVVLFTGLVVLATWLSAPTQVWHNFVFVIAAVAFMLTAHHLCFREMMIACMQSDSSAYDSVWIMPKLLIASHFVAMALYVVFPAFKALPHEQRPLRYELYGIWFFCWFFMILVLVFQSRLSFATRVAYMSASAVLALITMIFMPLGRFMIFNIASALGFSGVASVNRKNFQQTGSVSFTDAKILESQAWKLLEKDSFEEVVLSGRKVLSSLDRKTFASFWKAVIQAYIGREDYLEAHRNLTEYQETFAGTGMLDSGQVLEAYLRYKKGDFATAYKIVSSLPEARAKALSNDEKALCMMVSGACLMWKREFVQAHIEFGKAFDAARMPCIKAEILVEMTELDSQMKSKEKLARWKATVPGIKGGEKTALLLKTVLSMIAESEGQKDEAMKLAAETSQSKIRCGRALCWFGHLLCKAGRNTEAEELLGRMVPESVDANRLMNETTGSTS